MLFSVFYVIVSNKYSVFKKKLRLVVYLAHDLKTPLTSVIGYLSLLCDEKQLSDERRDQYLNIALEKSQRLEELIDEFFEITRFNLSDITLEYSEVNLTRLLEQLAFEFNPMFSEKRIECKLDIQNTVMICCDVNKIQRVFDNLLRNAVNYSYTDSIIRIIVTQDENNVYIQFINRGNTISKDKLDRIFEQFYRIDTARNTESGGAGLGLAIAKEITVLHKGDISAKSQNEMIEFTVILPRTTSL